VNEFGTLLGPEKTSGCWWMVFSRPAISGPGPSNAPLVLVGVVVVVVGLGCGGVLSVA
jgi:hypothetical protein